MKRIAIIKLDTPLTLVETAQRVPQAEPVNFSKALIKANPDIDFEIVMLGLAAKQEIIGDSVIKTVPYFGDKKSMKNILTEETTVIIWQGRQIIAVSASTDPYSLSSDVSLIDPWHADYYEKLSMLKSWQVQMYNLISELPQECKKFFLLTDCRLPLLELNEIDPVSVPKPLPKGITLITQAYLSEPYRKWVNMWGNGRAWDENNQDEYIYKFEDSIYAPLHLLPIMSHRGFYKPLSDKQDTTFQMQALRYMDDFRLKSLGKAIRHFRGEIVLEGQLDSKDVATIHYNYPEYADKLCEKMVSCNTSFHDAARLLADYVVSVVVTDARYQRFGLCPNRFIEALMVGTMPYIVPGVLEHCEPALREIQKEIEEFPVFELLESDANSEIRKRATEVIMNIRERLFNDLKVSMQYMSDYL